MDIEIDNLTVILLGVLVVLSLYQRFWGAAPMVPPLMLGTQSAPASVRQPGESPMYRSWATGQATPLQVRPAGQFKSVDCAVKVPPPNVRPGQAPKPLTQRYILDTPLTNEALAEVVRLVPLGIHALFPSLQKATRESPSSILTLLPAAPATSLPLLLLSLASEPRSPLVVLPHPRLLNLALDNTSHPNPGLLVVHESIFPEVLEQLSESNSSAGILIVGDAERRHSDIAAKASRRGIVVKWWEEIWDVAEAAVPAPQEVEFSDVHSYFYAMEFNTATVVKATHMNMTAGIAGLLSAFPADKRPTAGDVVGSSVHIDTPFGMTIALAAVWCGAGLRLIGPSKPTWEADTNALQELELTGPEQDNPSLLFLSPEHHAVLLAAVQMSLERSPFASIITRNKINDMFAGYVGRSGLIERLAAGTRTAFGGLAGSKLRALVVVGPTTETIATLSPVLLSVPLSKMTASNFCAGPVLVSHLYDLQSRIVPDAKTRPSLKGRHAHSGPPAANVEVVLRGPGCEPKDDPGAPFTGEVFIAGPSVLARLDKPSTDGWTDAGFEASVFPNGTFVVQE